MGPTGPRDAYGRPLSRREIDLLVTETIRLEKDIDRRGPESLPQLLDRTPYRPLVVPLEPPRRRRRSPRNLLLGLLAVALLVGGGIVRYGDGSGAVAALPAKPTTYDDGSYGFMKMQPGNPALPVGYNPCRRIPVVINYADGPPDILATVQEAIAAINRASGLHLEYAGASQLRRRTTAYASGNILISFNSVEKDDVLDGAAGVGGSSSYPEGIPGQTQYYVGGMVTLNTVLATYPHAAQLLVVEHELGHALGLAHATGGGEVMSSGDYSVTHFGHGDLTGLARLGQLPCQ